MKIRIIAVGKLKEPYLKQGIEEYAKRISKHSSVEVLELKEEKIDNVELAKEKEGKEIIKHLKDDEFVVVLDQRGTAMTSEQFSEVLKNNPKIAFVIGSHIGLSNEVLYKAKLTLSFSKLTFPHQMIRMFLYEQIYRGFSIIHNEKYHK